MVRNQILLRRTKEFEYILYSSNEEEVNDLTNLYKQGIKESKDYPIINEVNFCGHLKDIQELYVREFTPIYHIWYEQRETQTGLSVNKTKITEYKCYGNSYRNPFKFSSNVIIHETSHSSFLCACQCIRADYFIVLKKELNEEGEYKQETIFKEKNPIVDNYESIRMILLPVPLKYYNNILPIYQSLILDDGTKVSYLPLFIDQTEYQNSSNVIKINIDATN